MTPRRVRFASPTESDEHRVFYRVSGALARAPVAKRAGQVRGVTAKNPGQPAAGSSFQTGVAGIPYFTLRNKHGRH